jgi:TP901 family phage tail tape measure protein
MSDVNANIGINIDTSAALAELKSLQRQLAIFHSSVAKSSSTAAIAQGQLQRDLLNTINATGKFAATMVNIRTSAESFTHALETNKLGMKNYFKYAAGATNTFGKLFRAEFDTINKVAEDRVKKLQTQYIKMGRDVNGTVKAMAIKPLALDMQDFGTKAAIAAQRQALFNQLLRQGSTNLLNFGKNTQWAGRQLMVGFTIPLATLGSTAARTFMDMETAAIKFRKVYGDMLTPQSETKAALDNVQTLAKSFTQYGIAASQTVTLAADAAAAGFKGKDLIAQTTSATRLAVLGQIDQNQALQTTIALQNAFNVSSQDLASNIDFLNAVENQTVTSLDDITTAIPKVAPVIKQLGGDVKDLAFFLTAMKEGGVNASEGANALKSGLAALINPTNSARNMLKGMNIDIDNIVNKNKGDLKATVIGFAQALDTLAPLERARAIETMFGKFQFARLSALFQNVTKDGTQAARVLALAGTSVEDLAALSSQELGITADSAMNKFKKSVENLKVSLVPVGESFLKAVTPILEFFNKILDKFNNLGDGTKKFITLMTIGIGGIGPVLLMTFGLLANGLANILKLFVSLRGGFTKLLGGSQDLAQQTNYLTMEQLEAATVAASLNQAHTQLTQSFTAEATAVNQLKNAYSQANVAAQIFARSNPGMMLPRTRKGYASGGYVDGPGTSTSDSIPTLLSKGEFVVNAKSASRVGYGNLIRMNKMAGGGIGGMASADFAHITSRQIVGMQEFSTMLQAMPNAMSQSMMATIQELANVFGNKLKANIYSGLGFAQSGQLNRGMANGRSVPTQSFLEDFSSGGTSKWKKSLNIAGVKMDSVAEELTMYDNALKDQLATMVRLNNNSTITSDQFAAIEREVRSTLPEFSQLRTALNAAETTLTEVRFNISQTMATSAGMVPYQVPSSKDPSKMSAKKKISLPSGKAIRLGGDHLVGRTSGGMAQIDMSSYSMAMANASSDPYILSRDRNSPHPLAAKDGADDGKAYSQAEQRSMRATQSYSTLYGEGNPITAVDKSIRRNSQKRMSDITSNAIVNQEVLRNSVNQEKQVRQNVLSLGKMNSAIMGGTMALTSLAGVGTMFGGTIGKLSGMVFQLSGVMFGLMQVTQLMTKASIAKLVTDRIGAAKGAVGLAVEAGGMASRAGMLGALARVGVFARTLLGLTNPIGWVVLGLTATVGVIKLLNRAKEEERKKVEAFGDSLKNATKAAAAVAEYFNYIPTKSPLSQAKPIAIKSSGERQKIDQLVASDLFKSKDVQATISSLSKTKGDQTRASATAIGFQMLSQGASASDVQTYIDALLQEAGKTDVKIDFKSFKMDEKSLKKVNDEFTKQLSSLGNSFKSKGAFQTKLVDVLKNGVWSQEKQLLPTKELESEMNNQAANISTFMDSISNSFSNGLITGKQFDGMWQQAIGSIAKNTPDATFAITMLNKALAMTNPILAKQIEGFTNLKGALAIVEAAMLGVAVTEGTINALKIKATGGGGEDAASRREQDKYLQDLLAQIAAAKKEIAKANTPTGTGGGTGGKKDALQERIDATRQQTKAFIEMRKAGIDAATAADLSANPDTAKMIIDAAKKGGAAWTNLKNRVKEYSDEVKKLADYQLAGADQGDYEKGRLEMAQKYMELQSHIIDMQNRPQLTSLDKQITDLNDKIDGIKIKEEAIAEKYDKQITALNTIKSINDRINATQKERLSIASALTSGDISAAASAVISARASQSDYALQTAENSLTAAKDAQIKSLGRTELEKQVDALSKQKTVLEANIEKQKESLNYFGLTKIQIDDAVKSLDLAKNAGININDPAFLNNVLKGATGNATSLRDMLDSVAASARQAFLDLQNMRNNMDQPTITGGDGSSSIVSAGEVKKVPESKIVSPTTTKVTVQKGNTLSGIAKAAGVSLANVIKANPQIKNPNLIYSGQKVNIPGKMYGGWINTMAVGGTVPGQGMTDKVPVMLTPGEFVVNKRSAKAFAPLLSKINESRYPSSLSNGSRSTLVNAPTNISSNSQTVYNYSLAVHAKTNGANPDEIARTVISQIRGMESQRLKGSRV